MKTELASFNKIFTDSKELVDHEQRGKYFDRYCKLLGLYPNGREESGDSRAAPTVVINLGFLEPERAKQVLEDARK